MAVAANLIGQRFGNLTVLQRVENNARGNTQWLCKCDCGKTKVILGFDLTHGRSTTCGCALNKKGKASPNRLDRVGERYGTLTVIALNEAKSHDGKLVYSCKCDCGAVVDVASSNLPKKMRSHKGCPIGAKPRYEDLIGRRFGRLVVQGFAGRTDRGATWNCVCDCGQTKIVVGKDLRSGRTKSCGCLESESRRRAKNTTHGMTYTPIYRSYRSMISRCLPSYHGHSAYYDRGIKVCDEWIGKDGFIHFHAWAMAHGYDPSLTLDRIDVDKGYSPDNCRWATNKQQQNNRTDNVYVTRGGVTKTLKQWCEELGLNYGTVKARRQLGWSDDRLFEPPRH